MSDDNPLEITRSKMQCRIISKAFRGFDCVELVGHAAEQAQIRGITDADVLKTLSDPDETGLPTQPGRKRVRRNKTVRAAVDVVYEELGKKLRVITVIRVDRRISGRKRR